MHKLDQLLDVVLQESSEQEDLVDNALSVSQQLEEARHRVNELQSQLSIMRDKLCGRLSLCIRRRYPALNISVSRNGCKIGYKNKMLIIRPNVPTGVWAVQSPDERFAKKFLSRYSTKTVMISDMTVLADSVIQHFKDHYKAINEQMVGTGVILVDGKNSTLVGLAAWHENANTRR